MGNAEKLVAEYIQALELTGVYVVGPESARPVRIGAGRNEDGCEFEAPELIAAYKRGRRHVRSEDRLSADTSWD